MKRTTILALAVLTLAFAGAAFADASQLIPSFHWTYRSLGGLAQSGLIDAGVTPGKSAYNPEQVASMVVMAVKRAERGHNEARRRGALGAAPPRRGLQGRLRRRGLRLRRREMRHRDMRDARGTARRRARRRASRTGTQALVEDAAFSINEFTFDLYKATAAGAAGENVFLSPYSVSTALAMTYAGARGVTEG